MLKYQAPGAKGQAVRKTKLPTCIKARDGEVSRELALRDELEWASGDGQKTAKELMPAKYIDHKPVLDT